MRRAIPSISRRRTLRGLTLMEALLALAIGGIVISQSVIGINAYTESVRIEAAAGQLQRLITATDQYAQDNYQTLVANAPQALPVTEIEPYLGQEVGPDPFGNTYSLATRTYPVTVPDPANPGSTVTVAALQVLIVGDNPAGGSEIDDDPLILADIANTAGDGAGFRAAQVTNGTTILDTCGTTTGLTNTDICGAFGSYIVDATNFTAGVTPTAELFGLVTKGDATFFEDYLYRYDYGDPELNTMRTDIDMGGNNIDRVNRIRQIDGIDFSGPNQEIVTSAGDLSIESAGNIGMFTSGTLTGTTLIRTGEIVLERTYDASSFPGGPILYDQVMPEIRTDNGGLNLNADYLLLGEARQPQFHTAGGTTLDSRVGGLDSELWAGIVQAQEIKSPAINSLFPTPTDALRLQRSHADSLSVFGIRSSYNPGGGGRYDISDGDVIAQHITLQDVTCADCGGSLSHILPKWRHMGTYYVADGGTGSTIPKPACTDNRTQSRSSAAGGGGLPGDDDPAFAEAGSDSRYESKIIIIPRQIAFDSGGSLDIDFRFRAVDTSATEWTAFANATDGVARGLAMTYCVFTGGEPDPSLPMPDLATGGATFTSLE